jgi:hypothetical protein
MIRFETVVLIVITRTLSRVGTIANDTERERITMGTNVLRESGGGARIHVTREANTAELAVESSNDNQTRPDSWRELADVRIYGFDGAMLVVNHHKMSSAEIAELVTSAARDTSSIHLALESSIRTSGNGLALTPSGYEHAGFRIGDKLSIHPARDILVLTPFSPDDESEQDSPEYAAFSSSDAHDRLRLAQDLIYLRKEQLGIADQ